MFKLAKLLEFAVKTPIIRFKRRFIFLFIVSTVLTLAIFVQFDSTARYTGSESFLMA